MQIVVINGKGTTDAVFVLRWMQQKFRVKSQKLYFGFLNLEKSFDRVPREVIRWAMHKLVLMVSAVMSVYISARTVVRTVHGNSDNFEIKLYMYEGWTLRPSIVVCNSDRGYIQRVLRCLDMGVAICG